MMVRCGSAHSRQTFAIVIRAEMPFICIAPSPTIAITGRSGCAYLAAIAYGTAGPMVASPPDSDAIIPCRIFRSRAYHLAAEPESQVRMQLSGRRDDNSQNTRCGLIGLASFIARSCSTCHQRDTLSAIWSRHAWSCFARKCGISARSVALLSPTSPTSIG